MTLKEQMDRFKGQGPGFDACRLVLSISILCWHSILTSYGHDAEVGIWNSSYSGPLTALMPMFFALSGFLVMGSFERTNGLKSFLGLRALRILPALSVEIAISAFILGTLLTTVPLSEYFSSPVFYRYFGSLFGFVSYALPGVFVDNPDPHRVNLSLWTIAPEILCYLYLGLLMVFRLRKVGVTLAVVALVSFNLYVDLDRFVVRADTGVVLSRFLLISFAFGNLLYIWRDKIPYRIDIAALCLLIGLLFTKTPVTIYLALFSLAYFINFIGCTPIHVPRPFSTGDYSYGIYLYAYPIQQTYSYIFEDYREFYWNILFCLPITCLVAAASWWFIEKPALSWRKSLYRIPPAPLAPSYLHLAIPAVLLSAYGTTLWITSGLMQTDMRFRTLLPIVLSIVLVIAGFRLAYLRTKSARNQTA